MWGRKRWYLSSMGALKVYAWLQLVTLPFRFVFSEFTMFTREELAWLAKCHQVLMSIAGIVLAALLVRSLMAAQPEQITYEQVQNDRQDVRLTQIEKDLTEIKIEQAVARTAFKNLIDTLMWLRGILGVIAGTLLAKFGTDLFRSKLTLSWKKVREKEQDQGP